MLSLGRSFKASIATLILTRWPASSSCSVAALAVRRESLVLEAISAHASTWVLGMGGRNSKAKGAGKSSSSSTDERLDGGTAQGNPEPVEDSAKPPLTCQIAERLLLLLCLLEDRQGGVQTEFIYRSSGRQEDVSALADAALGGEGDAFMRLAQCATPEVLASAFKRSLAQLEPLVPLACTAQACSRFEPLKGVEGASGEEEAAWLLAELQPAARWTLTALLHHLRHVTTVEEVNHMGPEAIATVMAPVLLRGPPPAAGSSPKQALHEVEASTRACIQAVEGMLAVADAFGGPVADGQRSARAAWVQSPQTARYAQPALLHLTPEAQRTSLLALLGEAETSQAAESQGVGEGSGEEGVGEAGGVGDVGGGSGRAGSDLDDVLPFQTFPNRAGGDPSTHQRNPAAAPVPPLSLPVSGSGVSRVHSTPAYGAAGSHPAGHEGPAAHSMQNSPGVPRHMGQAALLGAYRHKSLRALQAQLQQVRRRRARLQAELAGRGPVHGAREQALGPPRSHASPVQRSAPRPQHAPAVSFAPSPASTSNPAPVSSAANATRAPHAQPSPGMRVPASTSYVRPSPARLTPLQSWALSHGRSQRAPLRSSASWRAASQASPAAQQLARAQSERPQSSFMTRSPLHLGPPPGEPPARGSASEVPHVIVGGVDLTAMVQRWTR